MDTSTQPPEESLAPRHQWPTCAWCGRGKLEVIKEWHDPGLGTAGVTLRCDWPDCGKIISV